MRAARKAAMQVPRDALRDAWSRRLRSLRDGYQLRPHLRVSSPTLVRGLTLPQFKAWRMPALNLLSSERLFGNGVELPRQGNRSRTLMANGALNKDSMLRRISG